MTLSYTQQISTMKKLGGHQGSEYLIPFDQIVANDEENVRDDYGDLDGEDLESISEGIKLPRVGYINEETGKFHVCDGFRRFKKYSRLVERGVIEPGRLPCKIDMSCTTPQGRLELALDLSSGKTLTLVEQGKGYLRLRDEFGLSIDEIASKRGKSKQHINNCIQLVTQTDDDVLEMVSKGEISATTVIETYQATQDPEQAKTVISEAVDLAKKRGKKKATAKDVEAVKGGDSTPKTTKSKSSKGKSDKEGGDTNIETEQDVSVSEDKFEGWDDNETTEDKSEEIQNLATFLGSTTAEDWIHLDVETLQQIVSMIS